MEYCVYKHTSPSNKTYIGITSDDPQKRWNNGHNYARNHYFKRAIDKYGWDSFSHEILFTGLSAEEAEKKERELIAEYRSTDRAYGYNLTDGGEKGKRHAPESIEKMRQAKIGMYAGEKNPRYGKHLSEDSKRKISDALRGKMCGENNPNYGKPMSEEQKRLISESRRGRHFPKLSEAVKNSPACKAASEKMMKTVFQYTKDGKLIRRWNSAPDAAEFFCGRREGQSNICSCANGNLKSAYGFVWRYEEETGGTL